MTLRHVLASSLLLVVSLTAWLPTGAACPADAVAPGCDADAGPEGASVEATAAEATLVVEARPPVGLAPGEEALRVSVLRLREPWTDELALLVSVGCPVTGSAAFCPPDDAFAGASAAQAGQWAGAATRTDWRSVGMWYEGDVAGHSVIVRGQTFQYHDLRRGSIAIWVDGFGTEQYGAFPVPV